MVILNNNDLREQFVYDKIDRLSGILYLLEGTISEDLIKKFKIIKDHRNYIAHGKRDVAPPAIEFKLHEIALILDTILNQIESRRELTTN